MVERHGLSNRITFRIKRVLLQARRGVANLLHPPSRLSLGELLPHIRHEIRAPLRPSEDPAEYRLTLGKIHNLRLSAPRFNGLVLRAGDTFSFWSVMGPMTAWRGYVAGREIREGCVIPNVGGGICQLSNALYQAALATGCEIVERHRHTVAIPGSDAERDLDATVAWNDIDLRFRAHQTLQIECFLTSEHLVVRFRSPEPAVTVEAPRTRIALRVHGANSCVTCGQDECDRHAPELKMLGERLPTWLMDAAWPEWLALHRSIGGRLLAPRRGAWGDAETVSFAAAARSVRARLVRGKSPPEVRRSQLLGDALVARALGRKLTYLDDDLIVAQSLLPFLWSDGVLAGRRFRVALVRAPLAVLHGLLDEAGGLEPESGSLLDFRADAAWVQAEQEALAAADGVITPHAGLARLFDHVEVVPWDRPLVALADRQPEDLIVFPGPAIARNGSKAVREVARLLGLRVMILGSMLEDRGLWDGIELVPSGEWESRALAVVQPSVMENRPVVLVRAVAAGVPVLAGPMCGLAEGEFSCVEFGDVEALALALRGLSCAGENHPATS